MSLQSDYYKTAILQLKRGNYNGHVSNAKTYYPNFRNTII